MADGSTFPRAPAEAIKRLQQAEQRQRNDTRKRGLPADPVCVEGLLLIQRNRCACGCAEPLDFTSVWDEKAPPEGYPVIAHRLARGSKGGHQVGNVWIDRWACNKRDASPDTSGAASVKRFSPDFTRKLLAPAERPKSAGKLGWKPDGYVSPLSKAARRKRIARND